MKLKVITLQKSRIPVCKYIYARDSFEYLQPIKKRTSLKVQGPRTMSTSAGSLAEVI